MCASPVCPPQGRCKLEHQPASSNSSGLRCSCARSPPTVVASVTRPGTGACPARHPKRPADSLCAPAPAKIRSRNLWSLLVVMVVLVALLALTGLLVLVVLVGLAVVPGGTGGPTGSLGPPPAGKPAPQRAPNRHFVFSNLLSRFVFLPSPSGATHSLGSTSVSARRLHTRLPASKADLFFKFKG